MEKEIYKDIIGYEGQYQVSNLGNVRSIERYVFSPRNNCNRKLKSCILKAAKNNCGYLRVCLTKENSKKNLFIHRLVATHFIPNPNNYPEVNHITGNKLKNRVSELEWVNESENAKHAYKNKLRGLAEKHQNAKLKNSEIIEIRKLAKTMTRTAIGKKFNVHLTTISNVLKGKYYQSVI